MVQIEKARPRSEFDHGLAAENSGDQERQADQGDSCDSSVGQGESQVKHRDLPAFRRLAAAIILQALKDLCATDKHDKEIIEWSNTRAFDFHCEGAGIDQDMVLDMIDSLYELPVRLRRDVMTKNLSKRLWRSRA